MSSLSATTIIMVEVIIILLALMGYLVFMYLRSNRDVMSAMHKLASKIRDHKDERRSMLHDFLIKTCHYDEENANSAAAALIEKERLFYSCLMEIYLTRDNDALVNLDTKTEEIISAYRNLLTVSVKAIATESELDLEVRTQQLSNTIEDLSDKNKTLGSELTQLKEEMDVTIDEYSSAFRNKANDKEPETDEDNPPQQETAATTPPQDNVATESAETEAVTEPAETETSKPDDSIEPEFHTRGINDPVDNKVDTTPDSSPTNDQNQAELEALAAQLDAENKKEAPNPSIPLDGLDDDNDPPTDEQAKDKPQRDTDQA